MTARLEGPLPGDPFLTIGDLDLRTAGYVREEWFLEGTASSYTLSGERGEDGRWQAARSARAPFKTRFVVYRPEDPLHFNGTVVVEWLNVSGGLDACPDWLFLHRHLMREGAAWVGVSAQKVGIDGGGFVPGMPLKIVNPERYGCLVHPGDAFAFDVYSEVGRALRTAGSGPLGQLKAQRMIAIGESQSAGFMVTYVNAFMNWAMYSTRLSFPQSLSGNPCPPLDARLRIAGMTTEYAAKYVAIFVPRPTIAGPGSAHHVGHGAELDPRQRAADEARRQGTQ